VKVVIDTNVVVSAVLKPGRNPEAVIRYIAQRADIEWIVSSLNSMLNSVAMTLPLRNFMSISKQLV